MNLYLVRHAKAVPVGGAVVRDFDRTLSAQGEEDALLMGRALSRIGVQIDLIVTSPLVRAVQTGEIMGHELGGHPVFRATEHLAPGFRHRSLLEELRSLSGGADIAAVGHQPDLGMFLSFLIADSDHASVAFSPCTIACLGLGEGGDRFEAELRWLISPETIRNLYQTT